MILRQIPAVMMSCELPQKKVRDLVQYISDMVPRTKDTERLNQFHLCISQARASVVRISLAWCQLDRLRSRAQSLVGTDVITEECSLGYMRI